MVLLRFYYGFTKVLLRFVLMFVLRFVLLNRNQKFDISDLG